MKGRRDKRALALMSSLLLVTQLALADPTYEFNIRGASLQSALRQFADQTGLQISYFTKVAEGRTAPDVFGTLTAEQALKALLKASGLTFERIDARTLAIYPAPPAQEVTATSTETAARPPRPKSLRLAQATTRAEGRVEDEPAVAGDHILEEVISTGSHIRGVVNETAPVTVFDRRYIERSGFTNMMQLVSSLPMNFKGGTSGATEVAEFGMAPAFAQNLTRGTGFNLRGLGSVATLTLINGRRVAPSAQGQFVDVSTIPLSAVERVEILTDGASAIYGADAVAGVVNIILRKDFEGAETGLEYGATTDGSLDEHRVSQMFGSSWETGNALFVGEYYRRSNLDVRDRDYILEAGALTPTDLLPDRKLGTLLFSLDQQLPANFDVSTNLMYSYEEVVVRSSMRGFTDVQTPNTNQWSAALGLGYAAPGDWRISLDGLIGRVKPDTDFTYWDLETGALDTEIQDYRDEYDTWSADLKADGTLLQLPGGPARLAIGGSYRKDDLISTRHWIFPQQGKQVRANDTRDVTSVFAELYVPIVGAEQDLAWARRIDLSIAARHDDYSDFGSTTNPKYGLVWTPFASLDVRATYSTSFRAPNVAEKAWTTRPVQVSTGYLDDPTGNGGRIPIFYLYGSRPLTAEESENIALGFTWRPQALSGFELAMNYFDIDYTNRIESPPYDEGALSRREDFGEFITEIPDDAAAAAYLEARLAEGWFFTDWEGIGSTGVRYLYDLRQQNAARTQLKGVDATLLYKFNVARDAFDLQLNVTHLSEILTSLSQDSTQFDVVDTFNQPLDWRVRLLGTWIRGGLSTTVVVSHADSYINDSQAIDVPIGSWTTADLNVSYDFDERTQSPLLDGTRLSFGVINITDREPPRANSPLFAVGFDAFNADALGRFISARFTKRW
ncbi:TonB-dependent receptor [Steroidobacter sp. S1-65]|uniref:TonB-dependent receptor n=1 Tax=Steroidobacter gossypii TaxID=2805490 RepID=A0ABS1WZI9_9GAMM|nr:TonB-dependent receptor [Steroidobacter gossypii]MBM0106387.1 TonB-dependent receptor [Steroidobacter gossypii]